MSGNPREIGYREDESYRSCKSCRAPITFRMRKGKYHPYNPDGTSHIDTCPYTKKPLSLLGDINTAKCQKWRSQQVFFEDLVPLDWHSVALHPLPPKHLLPILEVLEAEGGPFEGGVPYPIENIHTCAVCRSAGTVKAVIMHSALYERILAYFRRENSDVKAVVIAGYCLEPMTAVDPEVWEAYVEGL